MRSLRGRLRTSDIVILSLALLVGMLATVLLTRADQRMNRGAVAERLLERIDESENELYDASVALLEGEGDAAEVRSDADHHARQIAEIQSLDPDVRILLAGVAPADRLLRQR